MKFYVIGIDDSSTPCFSKEVKKLIASNILFSGGLRHYEIVNQLLPVGHKWINITPPMYQLFAQYESHENVVVFASGDPLFFGFATTIQRFMPTAEVVTFPYFNSLQQLAHATATPYHNMHAVSLTGRDWREFDAALIRGYEMIGVLTDTREHTPNKIAERMLNYGYDNYMITIGELLGNENQQRIRKLTVEQVIVNNFLSPNCLILHKTRDKERPFGILESEFMLLDYREKMITKMPVRLTTISELDLRNRKVFWDIGFCTGSVSIEVKLQFPHLEVIAFEVREKCIDIIGHNARKFGAVGIKSIIGDFVDTDINLLPRPDAVFIGGHGGKLREILEKLSLVLNDNGVVVFNSVSDQSRELLLASAVATNLTIEHEISLSVDNHNKINIIKAVK